LGRAETAVALEGVVAVFSNPDACDGAGLVDEDGAGADDVAWATGCCD
jgi:hypothetical protein